MKYILCYSECKTQVHTAWAGAAWKTRDIDQHAARSARLSMESGYTTSYRQNVQYPILHRYHTTMSGAGNACTVLFAPACIAHGAAGVRGPYRHAYGIRPGALETEVDFERAPREGGNVNVYRGFRNKEELELASAVELLEGVLQVRGVVCDELREVMMTTDPKEDRGWAGQTNRMI